MYGFSYASGVGLSVAGVILSWRYWSIGKCFELFVCTRPLDLASKYAISCLCKNSTVVFEVLSTSMQQRLFTNLISISLRGNFESNGKYNEACQTNQSLEISELSENIRYSVKCCNPLIHSGETHGGCHGPHY